MPTSRPKQLLASRNAQLQRLLLKGGELPALEAVNHSRDYMAARKLIADRARLSPDMLADPSVSLKDATV
jgi:hypothetical protein